MSGFFWLIILAFWLIPKLLSSKKAKQNAKQNEAQPQARPTTSAPRQTPSVQMHRPAPAMNRANTVMNRSAHRDFSAPEAPCIVCENTGDDHFQRDKARRLAQLDDWLRIGLIDREEYRVLKDRYQRGI